MSITQEVSFSVSPEQAYGALLSSTEFAAATGSDAQIEDGEGAAFSCFGGQITGRHIELIPNSRIVQAWRAGNWPEGCYSIVRFDLEEIGSTTRLLLHHDGFPDDAAVHLEGGWKKMYWEPLARYFDGSSADD